MKRLLGMGVPMGARWLIGGLMILILVGIGLVAVEVAGESAEDRAERRCDAAVLSRVHELVRDPAASATLSARHLEHEGDTIFINGLVDIYGVDFRNALGNNHDVFYCEIVNGGVQRVDVSSGR